MPVSVIEQHKGLKEILTATLHRALQEAASSLSPSRLAFHEQHYHQWLQEVLPTKKSEAYRYTPLATKFSRALQQLTHTPQPVPPPLLPLSSAYHLPLCAGKMSNDISKLPAGVELLPLHKAIAMDPSLHTMVTATIKEQSRDPFVTFNHAWPSDTLLLRVAPGTKLTKPLFLHHYAGSSSLTTTTQARLFLLAGADSQVTFIEYFDAPVLANNHWYSRVAHLSICPRASCYHYTLHPTTTPAWQMLYTTTTQASKSHYHHYSLPLGGKLVRHHLHARLQGQEAKAGLHGLYVAYTQNYHEHSLLVCHETGKTQSQQHYRGLIGEGSTSTFRGKIVIPPNSQGVSAHQQHHAWHLHPKARSHVRPELAIQTDDVVCSHGTTTSQPPIEQLLYMRTRGIPVSYARSLLEQGFAEAFLQKVPDDEISNFLRDLFTNYLLLRKRERSQKPTN